MNKSEKEKGFGTHHGCIKYIQLLSCWNVDCFRAHFSIQELVNQADIGKSASSHHLIIATSATVGIEIFPINSTLKEILCSRAVLGDASGGRNMICGYTVTKNKQAEGIIHSMWTRWIHSHVLEVRRLVNIGRFRIPRVKCGSLYRELVPHGVAFRYSLISTLEHIRQHTRLNNLHEYNHSACSKVEKLSDHHGEIFIMNV